MIQVYLKYFCTGCPGRVLSGIYLFDNLTERHDLLRLHLGGSEVWDRQDPARTMQGPNEGAHLSFRACHTLAEQETQWKYSRDYLSSC